MALSIKSHFRVDSTIGMGGMIALALNFEGYYRGSVTQSTYIALMTLMFLRFPFAMFLPKASSIKRYDGRSAVVCKQPSLMAEYGVLKKLLFTPTIIALLPLILYAQWFLSFQLHTNFAYFTVRARALNSFLFDVNRLIGALLIGQLFDSTRWQRKSQAKIRIFIMTTLTGTSWILGQIVQVHYNKPFPTLDWAEEKYGLGAFVTCIWGLSEPLRVLPALSGKQAKYDQGDNVHVLARRQLLE